MIYLPVAFEESDCDIIDTFLFTLMTKVETLKQGRKTQYLDPNGNDEIYWTQPSPAMWEPHSDTEAISNNTELG